MWPSPFLLFLPFFSFTLLPKHSRILVCRKMRTIPCVCCFVLCTARLSMPLFSLSSLCRTHRAPILISNGAKHKQSLAPVLDSPFYFHLSEEADMRQNHMFELRCPELKCHHWVWCLVLLQTALRKNMWMQKDIYAEGR